MDGQSPSASSKSQKKNCKCSKGRSTPRCTDWNSKDLSKRSGESAKPAAKQSSIHSPAQVESTWRKRRRTGTAYLGRSISLFAHHETRFCKSRPQNRTSPMNKRIKSSIVGGPL